MPRRTRSKTARRPRPQTARRTQDRRRVNWGCRLERFDRARGRRERRSAEAAVVDGRRAEAGRSRRVRGGERGPNARHDAELRRNRGDRLRVRAQKGSPRPIVPARRSPRGPARFLSRCHYPSSQVPIVRPFHVDRPAQVTPVIDGASDEPRRRVRVSLDLRRWFDGYGVRDGRVGVHAARPARHVLRRVRRERDPLVEIEDPGRRRPTRRAQRPCHFRYANGWSRIASSAAKTGTTHHAEQDRARGGGRLRRDVRSRELLRSTRVAAAFRVHRSAASRFCGPRPGFRTSRTC